MFLEGLMSWHSRFYKYTWFDARAEAVTGLEFGVITKRAESGDSECMVAVGVVHYSRQEYSEAIRWLSLAAEKGNTDAMIGLGLLHHKGQGVQQSEVEATRWFRLGAFKGNHTSMLYLGFQLAGDHFAEAMEWFRVAAKHGSTDAMVMIAQSYIGEDNRNRYESTQMRDPIESVRWYKMAAENGNAEAMRALGIAFELGEGIEHDDGEALRWYMLAAGAGDASAMVFLGLLYDFGFRDKSDRARPEAPEGSPMMLHAFWSRLDIAYRESMPSEYDFNEHNYNPSASSFGSLWASKWFRRAADKRHEKAYFLTGNQSHRHHAYDQALRWYLKAAESHDSFAMIGLGFMFQEGEGVDQDYAQAMQWYLKAHEECFGGNFGLTEEGAIAHLLVGLMYTTGRGVRQDAREARRWLEMKPESSITPHLNGLYWQLYAQRIYVEACHWLASSMSGLRRERSSLCAGLLPLFEERRSALASKLSAASRNALRERIKSKRPIVES
jgi:uncharacterized protein